MTQKIPIIAFSVHPWDEPQWMNRQHLLSRLAKRGWPVYYCTGALDWWDRDKPKWQSASLRLKSRHLDGVNIIEAGRFFPTWHGSKTLSRWAIRFYCNQIKEIAGIKNHPFIGLMFHPDFYPYLEQLSASFTHLHVYDLYWKQGGWTSDKNAHLINALDKSDLVTASSSHQVEELAAYTNRGVSLLENAADIERFLAEHECPGDLLSIPHPRIGNIGAVNNKMDLPLIREIALSKPEWHWVFIGPIDREGLLCDDYNKNAYCGLEQLPNVHFLGLKHRHTVPGYMQHMDVLTMAYRTSKDMWAYVAFPLRLVEYLASGRPVVSCPLKVLDEHFCGLVPVAVEPIEWIKNVQLALEGDKSNNVEKRKSSVLNHSWENRVNLLETIYQDRFALNKEIANFRSR